MSVHGYLMNAQGDLTSNQINLMSVRNYLMSNHVNLMNVHA
jgi:hypothetical protein